MSMPPGLNHIFGCNSLDVLTFRGIHVVEDGGHEWPPRRHVLGQYRLAATLFVGRFDMAPHFVVFFLRPAPSLRLYVQVFEPESIWPGPNLRWRR